MPGNKSKSRETSCAYSVCRLCNAPSRWTGAGSNLKASEVENVKINDLRQCRGPMASASSPKGVPPEWRWCRVRERI